jgi:hypothetical protein
MALRGIREPSTKYRSTELLLIIRFLARSSTSQNALALTVSRREIL